MKGDGFVGSGGITPKFTQTQRVWHKRHKTTFRGKSFLVMALCFLSTVVIQSRNTSSAVDLPFY
jgi:hypothetical protein